MLLKGPLEISGETKMIFQQWSRFGLLNLKQMWVYSRTSIEFDLDIYKH